MVHPDVVLRDVLAGLGFGLSDTQVHLGGNPFGEGLRQPDFRPLPARPGRTIFEAFLKRGERKIQQHDKGQLVLEEIIGNVGRRIVAADNFVEGKHRAEIEIKLLAELAVDLVHVSAQLLQQMFQAVEHRIQRGLISGEIGAHEIFKTAASPSSARQNRAT